MPPAKVQYKPVEIGDIYNNLEVIGYAGRIKKGKRNQRHWHCKCLCNNPEVLIIDEMNLKNGGTKSCGCLIAKGIRKAKLKKTFYDWCIENDKQWILDLWDYDLNEDTPQEISHSSHFKRYFKCKNGLNHPSICRAICDITSQTNEIECRYCNSFAQHLINLYGEDALEKYWDYEMNTVDPWQILKSCHQKVWIKCQDVDYHDSYEVFCDDFYMGNRCPYCSSKKVHPKDSLGALYPHVLNIWSDKNKKSPFEYAPNSNKKVWWKCFDGLHNDYLKSINQANKNNFHCRECSMLMKSSYLQNKVYDYLTELGLKHVVEYQCSIIARNDKTKRPLPYDNEITDLKLIIEVHGVQHYKITRWIELHAEQHNILPEESFAELQWRDEHKRQYALSQGYHYLIIPYWTEKDESYKTLINDKIAEIVALN